MHPIDLTIIGLYVVALLGMGAFLARKAAQGSDHYFLGGRRMPWWALGASGMSSNLDAAGTMTIVTLIYLFGIHGFFIEMRGGVVLPLAVFLAFMGKWHQRSQVMTTAEWMELRFGKGPGGRGARYTAAATYLVITIGMVVFFLEAAGKFLATFLPFDPVTCAVLMALVALIYTLMSGLYGVVWTDVAQAFLIGAAAIYVAVTASGLVTPELLADWPGAAFNQALPVFRDAALGEYEWFLLFLIAWAAKGLLEGLGGSGGSAYMAQRFYAARTATETQKLSMLWIVLFAFRWPMVLGFAIMGIAIGAGQDDVEALLPQVLQSGFFPPGMAGLVVAAIFAASMSTFDSTINAGASYVVKDLVQPLRPQWGERALVGSGYIASALIVAIGLTLSLLAGESVLGVWVKIVIQLFPAFLTPFALRWFWGRFNGAGFITGVACGFAAAFGLEFVPAAEALNEVGILSTVTLISLTGCLLGTYLGRPVPEDTLKTFYDRIRPFGLWPKAWKANDRAEHRADAWRLLAAVIWQISTFLLPMLAVLQLWNSFVPLFLLWLVLTVGLWRNVRANARREAADAEPAA